MFGHDDKDKNDDAGLPFNPIVKDEPTPDGTLDDSAGASMMGPPPAPPEPAKGLPFVPPPKSPVPRPATTSTSEPSDVSSVDDLVGIKQEALKQLSPLVSHLDQTPEEKFRTTMMMIQATDDDKLIGQAFEAAKQIKDDKTRAQALLDVINEINYFTQQNEK